MEAKPRLPLVAFGPTVIVNVLALTPLIVSVAGALVPVEESVPEETEISFAFNVLREPTSNVTLLIVKPLAALMVIVFLA